jgi:hypothetical protein
MCALPCSLSTAFVSLPARVLRACDPHLSPRSATASLTITARLVSASCPPLSPAITTIAEFMRLPVVCPCPSISHMPKSGQNGQPGRAEGSEQKRVGRSAAHDIQGAEWRRSERPVAKALSPPGTCVSSMVVLGRRQPPAAPCGGSRISHQPWRLLPRRVKVSSRYGNSVCSIPGPRHPASQVPSAPRGGSPDARRRA